MRRVRFDPNPKASWGMRFRAAGDEFGTIGGLYTIAELKDLIAAKDVEVAVLDKDGAAFMPSWQQNDPIAADNWATDFAALKSDYQAKRSFAQSEISTSAWTPLPANTIPADPAYRAILASLNSLWESHGIGPGSLSDLRSRLTAAGGKASVYTVPQPKAGSDADLNTYKAADTTLKAIAAPGGISLTTWAAIGAVSLVGIAAIGVLKR